MMQRWCTKLCSLASQSGQALAPPPALRLLHSSQHLNSQFCFASSKWTSGTLFNVSSSSNPSPALHSFRSPIFPSWVVCSCPYRLVQVRNVSSRERAKRRKPMTPATSKVKKIKMKSYSSFKSRFRLMNDGNVRRWKEGKRHNAHLKSKKSKRRLRKPAVVPLAYAKVMKKLNFCG